MSMTGFRPSSQHPGIPARMTLLQGTIFIAVGNENRWCELFLEKLCEKFVIVAGELCSLHSAQTLLLMYPSLNSHLHYLTLN